MLDKISLNMLFFLALFFLLGDFSSCGQKANNTLDFKVKLKPLITQSEVTDYFNNLGAVSVSRPKNVFLILIDTLREDHVTSELAPVTDQLKFSIFEELGQLKTGIFDKSKVICY